MAPNRTQRYVRSAQPAVNAAPRTYTDNGAFPAIYRKCENAVIPDARSAMCNRNTWPPTGPVRILFFLLCASIHEFVALPRQRIGRAPTGRYT